MCKLIRTKSEVLALVLRAQYVNEVFAKSLAKPPGEEKEGKPERVAIEEA